MRYVIFGGAFNPPHVAHLFMAELLVKEYGYDRIIFVPSNISSHKSTDELLSPTHRLAMLRELKEGLPWMEVNDCEIMRGGISYSIDTVRELYSLLDLKVKPGLLIGDDLLADFSSWKCVDDLIALVDLIVAFRSGGGENACPYRCTRLENLQLTISSSDIRRRIRNNLAYRFMLPDKVYQYIIRTGLYL